MTDDDNARFFFWLGDSGLAWGLYALLAEEIVFDWPCYLRGRSFFQGLCQDFREDELYLDLSGCLDAPL